MAFPLSEKRRPRKGRRKTGAIHAGHYLPEPRDGKAIFQIRKAVGRGRHIILLAM
ncbi:hypothetical protein [Achromobacter spanius]|uniref:hypothetical protein n=1 Tax=Achromobacter spanius TaxID=217203 RepID=UPI001319C796|nr:hypothetical protein [Achromobacter spanius]